MTSRYEMLGDTPAITRRRNVLACARCRAKRVKCDRVQPACSNCSKAGTLCQPASTTPQTSAPSQAENRDSMNYNRLSRPEGEMSRKSREPSRELSIPSSPEDSSEIREHEERSKIISDTETRYICPSSWAAVANEIDDIETMLGGNSHRSDGTTSTTIGATSINEHGAILPDDQLHETLLNIFSHRVDPMVRLVHWPSFLELSRTFRQQKTSESLSSSIPQYENAYYPGTALGTAQSGIQPNPPIAPSESQTLHLRPQVVVSSDSAFLALLYSVYYAAVVSVVDSPNSLDLGQNISALDLASTFKKEVTNRVMSLNENVAGSESIEMLQAVVLNLSLEPISQLQWLQLGVAIRMAQGLGVHRDGSNFGLRPIEIEVRRRIWAQICVLDVRFAEKLCREPTINMDSYDTALPLSICDADLNELDEQHFASRQGQESNFKTHREIEQEQEQFSPFSAMTLCLVEAETARLMAQLHISRYRSRDSIIHPRISSPRLTRRVTGISVSQSDKIQWVGRLESRFQSVYRLSRLKSPDSIQSLVLEMVAINIAKAKFVTRLMEWREMCGGMGDPQRDAGITRLFRDAVGIATRSLSLSHQYSHSPYSWYTKRLRDSYAASFMVVCLASDGLHIEKADTNHAWSVLQQRFPVEASGSTDKPNIAKSLLTKVLSKARARRETYGPSTNPQALRDQALYAAAGSSHHAFSTSTAPHLPITSTTSVGNTGGFQSSRNLFEDFDTIMQDPISWAPNLEGVENSYGSWV